MEKKISKNQKMYPHRFGCSQNHPKVQKWGFLALKGIMIIWVHFVILVGCECVILRPQIMLIRYVDIPTYMAKKLTHKI